MQELEKILEEIDEIYVEDTDFGIECNLEGGNSLACDDCYNCIKEACKSIIRKHMTDEKCGECSRRKWYQKGFEDGSKNNDGWISVEERMPTEEECKNEYFWIMLKYSTSPVIAKCSWIEADNVDGTDDSYPEFWIDQFPQIYRPSHRLIAAWKILELPEPYRQERSDNYDGE